MARHQQTYDRRLRKLVRQAGDVTIATGAVRTDLRVNVARDIRSIFNAPDQVEAERLLAKRPECRRRQDGCMTPRMGFEERRPFRAPWGTSVSPERRLDRPQG